MRAAAAPLLLPTSEQGSGRKAHPGFALALRRDAFEALGGLFEADVGCVGDLITLCAVAGEAARSGKDNHCERVYVGVSADYTEVVRAYFARAAAANDDRGLCLGCINGTATHAHHGVLKNRQYAELKDWMRASAYSPGLHMRVNADGLRVAAPAMPDALRTAMSSFWAACKED